MVAALLLPRLLRSISDRTAMSWGAGALVIGLLAGPLVGTYLALLPLWFLIGLGYSLAQTPAGRLLRRSAHPEDRPAVFAAQFALSHACWLITYPIAGWMGAKIGMSWTFVALAGLAGIGVMAALYVWPRSDPTDVPHVHSELAEDDPHLEGAEPTPSGMRHTHDYVIDARHPGWP